MKYTLIIFSSILVLGMGTFLFTKRGGRNDFQTGGEPAPPTTPTVRRAAVAGQFYPGEKAELSTNLDDLLAQATPSVAPKEKIPQILIVPHAGYSYSGAVAAQGFAAAKNHRYRRVILLGSSHQTYFENAAVSTVEGWETPLGIAKVDKEFTQKLLEEKIGLTDEPEYQAAEHSLEVEIPFLQHIFGDEFKIVPILLGQTTPEFEKKLAAALFKYVDSTSLVVVSTDLSHYPTYQVANEVDQQTIAAILGGDPDTLDQATAELMAQGHPNLQTYACGQAAVRVALHLGQKLGGLEGELLKYANSGDIQDIQPNKDRVVGYAAIALYTEREGANLDKTEPAELLEIARTTLERYLDGQTAPPIDVQNPFLEKPLGAFVTLRNSEKLRGCIGRFEPDQPLWQVVQQMAIAAATEDRRFSPVTAVELPQIKIEISVLSPRQRIQSIAEIEIGKHGIYLQKDGQSGVFLPQVATENNWDKETFLEQLCSGKAGLPPECYNDPSTELYTFTAQIFEEE